MRWVGHGSTESWQRYEDIPEGSRHLTREFNTRERERKEREEAGPGAGPSNAGVKCREYR